MRPSALRHNGVLERIGLGDRQPAIYEEPHRHRRSHLGTMRLLPEYCEVSQHPWSRSSQGGSAGTVQYHQQPVGHALGREHGSSPR